MTASLTVPGIGERDLWFSVPEDHAASVSRWSDPFVLGALQTVMTEGTALRVIGAPVSPSLIANLTLFQEAWHLWRGWPIVIIEGEEERERPHAGADVVLAYSGGIDSVFTLMRHVHPPDDRRMRSLDMAVLVHGFDIPVSDGDSFGRVSARIRPTLDRVGVPLVPVATNLRTTMGDWLYGHGLAIAATLTLMAGRCGTGIIGSSDSLDPLWLPWGTNPITDPLMGSDTFGLVNDGAAHNRLEKVEALTRWPDAFAALRFCTRVPASGSNCGRCRKCLSTALVLRSLDLNVDEDLFEHPPSARHVGMTLLQSKPEDFSIVHRRLLFRTARAHGVDAWWVGVLGLPLFFQRAAGRARFRWRRVRGEMRRLRSR